ncbi:MAG: hypothetical protein U0414_02410 [Polyangiaceae bacterium]
MTRTFLPVLWVSMVACGGADSPRPVKVGAEPTGKPSASVAAAPMESATTPSASASAAPSAKPDGPSVAKCDPIPAHKVEPFEQAGKTNFLSSISATAGTLEKETRAFETAKAKGMEVGCSLSHLDGELVVLQCTGTSRGSSRTASFETLAFTRTADGWKKASFEDLVPSKDAYGAIDEVCRKTYPDGLTKLGFTSSAEGTPFVGVVQPRPGMMFLGAGGLGIAGDGTGCDFPLERIAPWLGCGPLAPLHRPALIDGASLASGPTGPLGIDTAGFAGLQFTSTDPRLKKTVDAIQRVIDDWATANAKAPDRSCDVSLSTSELVAVRCSANNDSPADKVVEGFIFRTSDGARLPTKAIFAKRSGNQSDMTVDCLKPYFQPHDPDAPQIDSIPVLSMDDFKGFRLTSTTARFEVPLQLRRGKGKPLAREYVACGTTLTKLGTSISAIAAEAP